jgi:uncharacterized RDD family membrane protein YckC
MMIHDNPISTHGQGPTLAKLAVQENEGHWPVPEGTILAPLWKRIASYIIDTTVVMGVLLITTGSWIAYAWNIGAIFSAQWYFVLVNWALIIGANYLYHKYAVHNMGRSLGQWWFGLAVVREDGEPLQLMDCGRRSISKLRYLIPLLNIFFLFIDGRHIRRRHTHQSSIDLACASIVVIENSLPPAKRQGLR